MFVRSIGYADDMCDACLHNNIVARVANRFKCRKEEKKILFVYDNTSNGAPIFFSFSPSPSPCSSIYGFIHCVCARRVWINAIAAVTLSLVHDKPKKIWKCDSLSHTLCSQCSLFICSILISFLDCDDMFRAPQNNIHSLLCFVPIWIH